MSNLASSVQAFKGYIVEDKILNRDEDKCHPYNLRQSSSTYFSISIGVFWFSNNSFENIRFIWLAKRSPSLQSICESSTCCVLAPLLSKWIFRVVGANNNTAGTFKMWTKCRKEAKRSSDIYVVGGSLLRPLMMAFEKSDPSLISAVYRNCSMSSSCRDLRFC